MDYEKKMTREEAIEKVRKMSLPKETVEILEALAPELRESEDERIRKALIEVFKEKLERGFEWVEYGIPNRSVLSWLEKQKVEHPKEQNQNWELPEDFEEAVYKVANFISPFDNQEELRKASHRFAEQLLSLAKKELDKPTEKQDYSGLNDFEQAIHRGFLCAGVQNVPVAIIKETAQDCLAHLPAECGCTNDESEYDKGYREGHRFGLKQTQEYMLPGGRTFSGLIPCWVNAPSELQPAHKYHGKNVVIMHENNGGFRCTCIDDEKPVTFHLPEDTLFVEGWRKKPTEWNEEDESYLQTLINEMEANKKEAQEYEHKTYDTIISWLKALPLSLKKRNEDVAKLCSNEWSEKDERMLNELFEELQDLKCGNYRCYTKAVYDEWIAWLNYHLSPPTISLETQRGVDGGI